MREKRSFPRGRSQAGAWERGNEIVICLNNDTAKIPAFLKAQVVQSRLVLDEFWEYGVKFLDRLTIAEKYTALAQDAAPCDGATGRHE